MTRREASKLTKRARGERLATAKYATNLNRAKADGYQVITPMMPNMGFHFLNPGITGFNIRKPQILVYEHHGSSWQLGALEWVFPTMPKTPPLPNATFGFFPAACHYKDGTFIPDENSKTCPKTAPNTGANVQLLAPGPDHDARVGLVPQPRGPVLQHQPAGRSRSTAADPGGPNGRTAASRAVPRPVQPPQRQVTSCPA